MSCVVCGANVHPDRVEWLRDNNKPVTCLAHSTAKSVTGFMVFSHKTAPELMIIPDGAEARRVAERAFKRSR
jgi:hypothetical protein